MSVQALTAGIRGCQCGKDHLCPIDYIYIEKGALQRLPEICKGYQNIFLLSDQNTWAACGQAAAATLGDKVAVNLILQSDGPVIPNEETLAYIKSKFTPQVDLMIGVGSGVINDLCKQISFEKDLPYYIVATAPSMDSYASVGSALILGGMKITLNARPPKAILADTEVLKNAPFAMIQAGYGDIVGKFSCLNDWELSTLINGEYFCRRVFDLTYNTALQVKELADGIAARDEEAVGRLMEALVTVGVAMSYVGNSRPASGSEHHLSHFFEITGILEQKEYFAHGIDVAYSAVVTAELRERILKSAPQKAEFNREAWEQNIRRVYGTSAQGVIDLQDKLGWYLADDSAAVYEKWPQIKSVLAKAPTAAEMQAMVEQVGLRYAELEQMYGKAKLQDAVRYAKDLKDRYSVLWLYDRYFKEV